MLTNLRQSILISAVFFSCSTWRTRSPRPPATGPDAGYTEDDLARDLGLEPGDRAVPRAAAAYRDAFTGSFWQETERAAREHTSG